MSEVFQTVGFSCCSLLILMAPTSSVYNTTTFRQSELMKTDLFTWISVISQAVELRHSSENKC